MREVDRRTKVEPPGRSCVAAQQRFPRRRSLPRRMSIGPEAAWAQDAKR